MTRLLGPFCRLPSGWLHSPTPEGTSSASWERLTAAVIKKSLSAPSPQYAFPH